MPAVVLTMTNDLYNLLIIFVHPLLLAKSALGKLLSFIDEQVV